MPYAKTDFLARARLHRLSEKNGGNHILDLIRRREQLNNSAMMTLLPISPPHKNLTSYDIPKSINLLTSSKETPIHLPSQNLKQSSQKYQRSANS